MKEKLTDGRQKITMASCILLSYEIRILGKQSKSFCERVDCRPQNSITITIIQERKPQKLFNILNEQNNTISNPYAGIYYICGSGILFSTQIIVSCELDKQNHIWLASLTNDITKNEAHYLIRKAKDLKNKQDKENADALLNIAIRANEQIFSIYVLSESFDIWISEIDFYYTMKFSQCVHGMYDEKTEAV